HFENSLCRPCGPEQSLREESSVRGVDPMLREGANNKQTDLNSSATYRPNKRAKLSEFDFVDPSSIPVINDIVTSLGIATLENVLVDHCWQSYAVSVVSTMGWKLVYSGDTRPCQQLVTIGKNATILIHEATFDDTKPDEAVKKKHSTISEAVTVSE
ncbi:ELAC2, partial [Symbiodinium microadriaticum]